LKGNKKDLAQELNNIKELEIWSI